MLRRQKFSARNTKTDREIIERREEAFRKRDFKLRQAQYPRRYYESGVLDFFSDLSRPSGPLRPPLRRLSDITRDFLSGIRSRHGRNGVGLNVVRSLAATLAGKNTPGRGIVAISCAPIVYRGLSSASHACVGIYRYTRERRYLNRNLEINVSSPVQSACTPRSVEDEPARISRNIEIKTRLLGTPDDAL